MNVMTVPERCDSTSQEIKACSLSEGSTPLVVAPRGEIVLPPTIGPVSEDGRASSMIVALDELLVDAKLAFPARG